MLIEYLMTLPPPYHVLFLYLLMCLVLIFLPAVFPPILPGIIIIVIDVSPPPPTLACCLCFSSPAFHFSIDFNLKGQVSLFVKVAVCVMYGTLFFPLSLSVSLHGGDGTSYLMPGQLLINSFFQIK